MAKRLDSMGRAAPWFETGRLGTSRRRKAARRKNGKQNFSRRGAALIMVLGSLTMLAIMLSEFQDEMSAEFSSAMAQRDAIQAEYAAHSAINLARLLIAAEPTVRTSAGLILSALSGGKPPQIPVWEFAPQILGAFSDGAGAEEFQLLANADVASGEELGLGGAGFRVNIVDEDSKISLNTASRSLFGAQDVARQLQGLIGGAQYDPLFQRRNEDGETHTRTDICSAIIDWVDGDQDRESCDTSAQAQTAPPEDAYYKNLDNPYDRKNAAFDSLEELRMVRGVGDDFWATFIEPDPFDGSSRPVTVWSQGKININTAAPLTLLSQVCAFAVPSTPLCNDPTGEMPAGFLQMMTLAQGMFSGIPLFRSPKQLREALEGKGPMKTFLEAAGVAPIEFLSASNFEKGLTLESKVFSIEAEGYVKRGKREAVVRMVAVVDFRKAPAVEAALQQMNGNSGLGAGDPTNPNAPGAAGDDETPIQGAITPSTGGRMVYFRVY